MNQKEEERDPIMVDFSSNSRSLVVAFGSMRLEMETPPFEWVNILTAIDAKKIFLRDPNQIWYLKGLPGIGDSPEELGSALQQMIIRRDVEKVITIGGSMGGYAAILFGHLLAVDEVHAFGAQTFLPSRKGRFLAKTILKLNWRMMRKQWELRTSREFDRKYFDLRPMLMNGQKQTSFYLYFSTYQAMDVKHARNVEGVRNVYLREQSQFQGHQVGVALRNAGILEQMLKEATIIGLAEESMR